MTGRILAASWATAATLLNPVLRLNLRRRAAKGKEVAERLPERFGIDATVRPDGTLVWMHAASVGETMSVLPVLTALRRRTKVLLTTGTVTSQALLDQRLPGGDSVVHRFAPLDVPCWVNRFLDHWRPDAACFVESELWPNQLAACQARGIKMMLMNGRMSESSFRQWQRVPRFARRVVGAFAIIQARGELDAERLRALGGRQVDSVGDLKFGAPPLPVDLGELERLKGLLGGRPVWIAASTHPGEEDRIVTAHRMVSKAHPDLLTIIAPRHPERGAALSSAIGAPRRGAGDDPPAEGGIWIADTMGELGLLYRLAPIAFVGRSLIPPGGGQNPLEPARLGCAVAVGPFTTNFDDHVALLRAADGLVIVADEGELAQFVCAMIDDPERRANIAENAAASILRQMDLPERSAEALLSLLPRS